MQVVTFEIAELAKEKGFDHPTIYAWCEKGGWNKYKRETEPITHILRTNGNPFGNYVEGRNWNKKIEGENKNKIKCSAPNLYQLQKWLRGEHSINVIVNVIKTGNGKRYTTDIFDENADMDSLSNIDENYEKALEKGIHYSLELI